MSKIIKMPMLFIVGASMLIAGFALPLVGQYAAYAWPGYASSIAFTGIMLWFALVAVGVVLVLVAVGLHRDYQNDKRMKDSAVIERTDQMCAESASPEVYDMWLTVMHWLRTNRGLYDHP